MGKPKNFENFTLYRIYYDDIIVYLGRTMQPLQNRIRGHLFKKPMHREIQISQVSKIEYATFKSQADMYLYEIYFINLWKPALNKDDKATDELSVELPSVKWQTFSTHLWDKWKKEIEEIDAADKKRREQEALRYMERIEMGNLYRQEKITLEEYQKWRDGHGEWL